jgi:hypothetical protein
VAETPEREMRETFGKELNVLWLVEVPEFRVSSSSSSDVDRNIAMGS